MTNSEAFSEMKLECCEIHDNIRWPGKCNILQLFQNICRNKNHYMEDKKETTSK